MSGVHKRDSRNPNDSLYDGLFRSCVLLACAGAFVVMAHLASNSGLWLDEIFQVEYCREAASPADMILVDPYTPPLFNIIAWCWYQVIPFGELWLRLPSILFVCTAALFIALTGRRIGGRRVGLVAALLLLINAKVVTQGALTFRTYGLLLLASCIFIYLYVRRVQRPPEALTWKLAAGYTVALLALGYTHYFGIVLAAGFFVVDVVLLARGRLRGGCAKVFAPYAAAVVCYLPWLAVALGTLAKATTSSTRIHWQTSGSDAHVSDLLYWLFGECSYARAFFYAAVVAIAVTAIVLLARRNFEQTRDLPIAAVAFAPLFGIAVMWAYCRFINPESMFWVQRYFLPMLPCMLLACAWGLVKMFAQLTVPRPAAAIASLLCVALLVPTSVSVVENDLALGSSTRFYRDLTHYLVQQDDIEDDDTLVLAVIYTNDRGRQVRGWEHYYFDKKDSLQMNVTIVDGWDTNNMPVEQLLRYNKIYVTCQHFDPKIPEIYQEAFVKHYTQHETGNPGGGTTYYYTRN